jgi:hypothetical protein
MYRALADAVLILHVAVVVFIVGGFVAIVIGNLTGHTAVNARWFRIAHLGAIAFVVLQTWLGQLCPLTTLESWLRVQAGEPAYTGSFIEEWLHRVLFYDAAPWVFTLLYSVFGALVVASWFVFPPNRRKR